MRSSRRPRADALELLEGMELDSGFSQDIKAWSSRTGDALITVTEEEGAFQVFLRRNETRPSARGDTPV